jgi:hypothetical protein
MEDFKVRDKVIPKSTFAVQEVGEILALGEPGINGYPAWIKYHHQKFGQIKDLEYMTKYFEPGFFQLRFDRKADVVYKTSDPGPSYQRVSLTVVEDNNA